jgi:hypothetical protein
MQDSLATLGFLSLFHVIGAIALANGLRQVWSRLRHRERGAGSGLFFIIWGAMFGCMPFAFGLQMATGHDSGRPLLLLAQIIIWAAAFLVALLAWDEVVDWLRPFLHPDVFLIAFGGLFMLIGAGVGSFVVRDEPLFALLFGGIFMLVGCVFFVIGVRELLKTGQR